jgi:hypothetical protein
LGVFGEQGLMDSLETVTFLVLFFAIAILFAEEIKSFVKKILAIRGMQIILSLCLLSFVILQLESSVLWSLAKMEGLLHSLTTTLANCLPFKTGAVYLAKIAVLLTCFLLPAGAVDLRLKKRTYESVKYASLHCLAIWLIVAILLVLTP